MAIPGKITNLDDVWNFYGDSYDLSGNPGRFLSGDWYFNIESDVTSQNYQRNFTYTPLASNAFLKKAVLSKAISVMAILVISLICKLFRTYLETAEDPPGGMCRRKVGVLRGYSSAFNYFN